MVFSECNRVIVDDNFSNLLNILSNELHSQTKTWDVQGLVVKWKAMTLTVSF